jgi:amino acid adenylation domain-containing protein
MSNAVDLLNRLRALGVQLNLEGETLRLNAPKGALTLDLQAALRANKAEIVTLLRTRPLNGAGSSLAPIGRVERKAEMPLSLAQQRLWFLDQMDPDNVAYDLLALLRIVGHLEVDALERSLRAIILRHENLRTTFLKRNGSPYTVISDGQDWRLEKGILDRRKEETLEQAVSRFAESRSQDPFDLETGPLLRAFLLTSSEGEYVLALAIHHIVSDGWSMGVLVRELAENYRAFRLNENPSIPELQTQYVDYAEWQRKWLETGVLEEQTKYWKKQLDGAPAVTMFPPDHARAKLATGRGKRSKLTLSAELREELEVFSRRHDSTLFMTMLSAFMLLLSRYSGQKDVVIGSPSANRSRAELNELIGFFVNNLVLRVQAEDGISFLDLLKRVREATLGAFEHQDAPFDHLVRELQADRGLEFSPLFQTMFTLQNFPLEELKLADLTILPLEIDQCTARFDLTVEVYPYRKQLLVFFDYNTDLYEGSTVVELQKGYEHVLRYVIAAPETVVESVPLMPSEAKEQMLAWGNDTAVEMRSGSLLLNALGRYAIGKPDKIAVRADGLALTYAELNVLAEDLALRLRSRGATKGTLIPVCLNRSTNLLVALLAVLKTGAAYVPLDPIYPRQRIAGILEDVKPEVLITERSLLPLVSEYERHCILLDDLSNTSGTSQLRSEEFAAPGGEDLAYVIFTSGSTGRPKGVEISHGALANFLESMRRAPGFTSSDRILAVTTVSFDIAGLELFLPIYAGGEVVIALTPGDLPALLEDLEREKPTVMQATPALWQMLVSAGWEGDQSLTALCGGEALTRELAILLLPRVKELWNMYGPTETTIWSSALRIEGPIDLSVPVGGPIQNTTFYVLDAQREPVPLGVAGELYIGGDGLARGYLHRPELTAERFITAPFRNGERLYRTGDLVRRRRNGTLEFLGRADFQVKLRGFRIELGEIEHALRQQPEVAECVVVLREDGGSKALVAYLVLSPGEALPYARLRQRLRERIPEYMVPAHAVFLERFPRLPNSKLDRSKLPAPSPQEQTVHASVIDETQSATEAAIARVLRELLNTDRIGVDQRFFDLGAHSLMLVKAHDMLKRELDPELRLVSLFQYPSIAALAAHIDRRSAREGEIQHAGRR